MFNVTFAPNAAFIQEIIIIYFQARLSFSSPMHRNVSATTVQMHVAESSTPGSNPKGNSIKIIK